MVNAPAQLATATALGLSPSIAQGAGANAGLATAFGNAGLPGTSVTSNAWPAKNLGVKIELLLAGTWTDITQYVYQRNDIQISGWGRADWTATIQPAQLTLTVNNRDGRFTPKLAAGAYFPNITRNTQIRVFVSATSTANVSYAGYRFYGEVAEWPLVWDPSQRDIVVNITANGIWRRLSNLQTSLGSAFRRYFTNNAAALGLQSYWPIEDGTGSGQMVPFASAAGTGNALQQFVAGAGGLSLASSGAFKGSDAIAVLNAASIIATVPAGGSVTANVTRFLLSVPQAGDSASGTTNWNLIEIDSTGTTAKFEVYLNASGTLLVQLRNSGGTVIAQGTTTTNVKGIPYLVSCEITAGGNWALRLIQQGASGITESMLGTGAGTLGQVTKVVFSRAFQLMDTAVGHLAVAYGAPTSMVQAAYALNGYLGELALDRFKRICGEMGIAFSSIGTSSAPMGPQDDQTLAELLQTIEDTDCGLLYELRDTFGLGYRTNGSLANQAAQFTLDYSARTVDQSFAPQYDDQLARNNVTVTNWSGYTAQSVLTTGPMSILNPPNGIGNGYNYSRNVNAANDNQVPGIATFLLNVGTVDEIRFPVVTVKMVRPSSATLFSLLPGLRIGDYFQITNPPSFLTASVIKQLMWGYTETINAKQWTFALNTVPESPWETGFSPGTVQTAQIPGGSPVSSQAQGALGLSQLIANGSITPGMLNSGITVHTIGGSAITISVNAPSSPNVNDIWINATTGLISQWDGSTWQPFKFDASQTIIAGTIVTANIAASAITSSLIAAGTVVAGIVDATTVQAAQYIATGTQGEFLAYTGIPALGNLGASISGLSGTDSFGNSFAKGIEIQSGGLILDNQGSTPAATSGASTFFSSNAGRPRYLSQTGANSILERSEVNVSQFTPSGGNTIAAIISAALNYQAGEGLQSSEYEIEIDGIATAPTSATGTDPTLTFELRLDGASWGASFTVGAVCFPHNAGVTVNYTARFRAAILSSGAGGTAVLAAEGSFNRAATNAGNATNQNTTVGSQSGGTTKNIDTTASHTIQVYSNWATVTSTGHSITTYRTRLTRRD